MANSLSQARGNSEFKNISAGNPGFYCRVDYSGIYTPGYESSPACGLGSRQAQALLGKFKSFIQEIMDWPLKITTMLKRYHVHHVNYVPDAIGEKLLRLMREDKEFHLVPLTREEEGVGISAGQAVCGVRPLLLMPTSGLGNALNAIASLPIPYRIPLPMIIGLRGGLGEFNAAQVTMGQAMPQILDAMRIPRFEINREDEVEVLTEGFLRVAYSTESPAALILSTQLVGWKE